MANPFASIVGQRRAQSLLSRGSKMVVPLGPWPRGMINAPRVTNDDGFNTEGIPEGAASLIVNFDVLQDGSLQNRLGFVGQRLPGSLFNTGNTWAGNSGYSNIVGSVYSAGYTYLLVSEYNTTLSQLHLFWVWLDGGILWASDAVAASIAGANIDFVNVHLYQSKLWLVSRNNNIFGKSSTAGQLPHSLLTIGDVNTMPFGDFSLIVKDRMFIAVASTSRVNYSKATDPTIWTAPDGGFFDVDPSNGTITALIETQNNIFIFKDTGIWLFSFTTDPAIDGFLRKISTTPIWDALIYNGIIYAVGQTGFFEIIQQNVRRLDALIAEKPNRGSNLNITQSSVFRVGDKVGFRYWGGVDAAVTKQYRWAVYNLLSGTWTLYDTAQMGTSFQPGVVNHVPLSQARHGIEMISGPYKVTAFPHAPDTGPITAPGILCMQTEIISPRGSSTLFTDIRKDNFPDNSVNLSPKYLLETHRYMPTGNKLFKLLYGGIEWYCKSNGAIQSMILRIPFSIKRLANAYTQPNNPANNESAQPEHLFIPSDSVNKIEYTHFNATNDTTAGVNYDKYATMYQYDNDPNVVSPASMNASKRVKTRWAFGQLYIAPFATGVSPEIKISNLFLYTTPPSVDINDPIS